MPSKFYPSRLHFRNHRGELSKLSKAVAYRCAGRDLHLCVGNPLGFGTKAFVRFSLVLGRIRACYASVDRDVFVVLSHDRRCGRDDELERMLSQIVSLLVLHSQTNQHQARHMIAKRYHLFTIKKHKGLSGSFPRPRLTCRSCLISISHAPRNDTTMYPFLDSVQFWYPSRVNVSKHRPLLTTIEAPRCVRCLRGKGANDVKCTMNASELPLTPCLQQLRKFTPKCKAVFGGQQ